MKSFYEHLRVLQHENLNDKNSTIQKKEIILRSSGIFPVVRNSHYSTQILFLSYWLLKRNIPKIHVTITLRDQIGTTLKIQKLLITEACAYSIDLDQMLDSNSSDFIGSIEVEFFSNDHDMVYPFPALVLNYFSNHFNTCVHTIGRIYNDLNDQDENEKSLVPETGFDINSNIAFNVSSFIAFVNGPKDHTNSIINYTITNHKSDKFSGTFCIGNLNKYQTTFVSFSEYIPKLDKILNGKSGAISLTHNFEGFFPRFLAGTIVKSKTLPNRLSVTHTYYDCQKCNSPSDYWQRISNDHHDSSMYIPIFTDHELTTELIIYPNLSPSCYELQMDLYNNTKHVIFSITPSIINAMGDNNQKLVRINFNDLIDLHSLNDKHVIAAQLNTNFANGNKIPTRIKYGLNVGINNMDNFNNTSPNIAYKLSTNICFNARLGNPEIDKKPSSFHWSPIFNHDDFVLTIGNFSTKKKYIKPAQIFLNFYHESNGDTIEKDIDVSANTEYRFKLKDNLKIKSFLDNKHGWVTIRSNNPYVQGFYFNVHYNSNTVAGDHVF